jgi:hypothetical protein
VLPHLVLRRLERMHSQRSPAQRIAGQNDDDDNDEQNESDGVVGGVRGSAPPTDLG